jgi:hypothetical protein
MYTNRCTCTFGRCGDPECASLTTADNRCPCLKVKGHDKAWRNIPAGSQECQECWKNSDPQAWSELGPTLQLIPLDMDAWQQSLTTVAAPGKGAAGTGAAGKGPQMNFQERIDDLEHRLESSQRHIEQQEHHIDALEQTLQDQRTEHEVILCQHAEQIQALENQVYSMEWKYDEIWKLHESMKYQ